MRDELEPVVGKWYLDIELDEQFRIVAIDEEREVVEIQYLDGEADEIELDAWSDLDLEPAKPPEEDEDDDEGSVAPREPDAGEADDYEDEEDEDEDDDDWDDEDDDDQYGSE